MELTIAERKAINQLRRIAKTWPKSLWLFSANSTLEVMRKSNGEVMRIGDAYDQKYIVDSIDIENDGGDW